MKNLLLKISILALVLSSITACQTQRHFATSKAQYKLNTNSAHKGTSQFFIGGIGQTDRIDAVKICGGENNIQAVETTLPFIHGLIGVLTLSIYTPREYTVYCK